MSLAQPIRQQFPVYDAIFVTSKTSVAIFDPKQSLSRAISSAIFLTIQAVIKGLDSGTWLAQFCMF
jgi:hypothetical protein